MLRVVWFYCSFFYFLSAEYMTFTLLKMHLLNFYSANMNAGGHLHFVKQEETLWFQRLRGFYIYTFIHGLICCSSCTVGCCSWCPSELCPLSSDSSTVRGVQRLSLQLVGICGLWVALFSPPTCMVEKQWCHSAVSPCYFVQAPPFDFERSVRSCIL